LSKAGNDILDDIAGLSPADETRIGAEVHQRIIRHARCGSDHAELQRIERLAGPFLGARQRLGINYRFTVLEDEQINAFAHLGGYVYVNRGLLRMADDDSLRFVLGHEIAHGDLRHCVKNMTAVVRTAEMAGDMAGSMAGIAYQAIALGYSEDCEFEADAWSYLQMRREGISHMRALTGLTMLKHHSTNRGAMAEGNGPTPKSPNVFEHLAHHFRSHPPLGERRARLEEINRGLQP
jgi:predicted Zn-dependent protease